ncbi:reverse transcriptase domain-containing protein [Tanacetum coccineum]
MAAYEANQNNRNGNRNPNVNVGGVVPVACECTYQDFVKCQPLNFKGTEGVVGLTRWFEKMETVFYISNCPQKCQVKYASCTLQDSALTWWTSHKRTIGTDVVHVMTWKELMKLMTEVYYPRNEIQKMETELWNLAVRGNDLTAYIRRFQELILLCTKMVPEEEDRVEKFIRGLPDNIQGNKPKGYATRDSENKRRFNNNPRGNRVQQPPLKRKNVAMTYTVRKNKNKGYAVILPLCDKCKLHHHGLCPVRSGNCKKVGNQARDYWASTMMTCYGCERKGHTKRCLALDFSDVLCGVSLYGPFFKNYYLLRHIPEYVFRPGPVWGYDKVHARIVTESAKKKSGGRKQEVADIIQAFKESKKTSRRQPGTGGSNEGTSSKPGVPDESIVIPATSSEGTGAKPGVSNKDKDINKEKVILKWGDEQDSEFSDDNDDVEKDDKDGDADDEGDDHVSDTQDANDEDVKTESDEDEIYKYKIPKEEAEKTSEAKDDTKKYELPPSSSSLSVSSGFGDQFLKLSFDSSLVSTVKDSADADVSSLLDIPIQYKTPQTQSPSVQKIPVSVIPETTNLPPIPEIITKTPVSTIVLSPQVTPIILSV